MQKGTEANYIGECVNREFIAFVVNSKERRTRKCIEL